MAKTGPQNNSSRYLDIFFVKLFHLNLRLYVSNTASGPWTQVLDTQLVDSRQQQDPLPLQLIALDTGDTTAQFIKFELLSYWGRGAGLEYFDIQRTCPPEDVTVVSGDIRDRNYAVEAILTHDLKETCCPGTYWHGPEQQPGAFILDLGCRHTFKGIKLVNTHNGVGKNFATKQFK